MRNLKTRGMLTLREAALYLGYTYATLRKYVDLGKILPDYQNPRKARTRRYFHRRTLDRFKASREAPGRRWPAEEEPGAGGTGAKTLAHPPRS